MIEVPGDCFYYELKLNKSAEIERFEYGFRFTVVPCYDNSGIQNILKENDENVKKREEFLLNHSIEWTNEMNLQFIHFIQNLAVIHSYSPMTMTPADLLSLMTNHPSSSTSIDENGNENLQVDNENKKLDSIQMPDPIQYPALSSIHLFHLQYRFALIYTLNHRLNLLLQNTEMELVHEWWSMANKLKELRSSIFTSIKLEFLRLSSIECRAPPFQVTIDRRLAQDSSKL